LKKNLSSPNPVAIKGIKGDCDSFPLLAYGFGFAELNGFWCFVSPTAQRVFGIAITVVVVV
jgi:hypothetical protein